MQKLLSSGSGLRTFRIERWQHARLVESSDESLGSPAGGGFNPPCADRDREKPPDEPDGQGRWNRRQPALRMTEDQHGNRDSRPLYVGIDPLADPIAGHLHKALVPRFRRSSYAAPSREAAQTPDITMSESAPNLQTEAAEDSSQAPLDVQDFALKSLASRQ